MQLEVIAEDVAVIAPELTWNNTDGSVGGVDAYYINMYLLNECKKMYNKTNLMDTTITSLQEQISSLQQQINGLQPV